MRFELKSLRGAEWIKYLIQLVSWLFQLDVEYIKRLCSLALICKQLKLIQCLNSMLLT